MTKKEREYIGEYLFRKLYSLMDANDAEDVKCAIEERIVRDVEECADPDGWNSGDVDMAFARLLKEKFCGK